VSNIRVFAVGGYLSYRALFNWLSPQLYVLTLLVPTVTQLFFFVFLGRAAGVENDAFFTVGNALVAAAAPGLFGMAQTISDERYTQTLALLVVSPANRVAVFLGRAAPVLANGFAVAVWAFVVGALVFGIHVPVAALPALALTIAVSAFACVGLGLCNASLGLRWRETGVFANLLLYVLLIFAGVNVPLERLPGWMSTLAQGLPVTHGVKAARELVGGASFSHVVGLIGAEALVGASYAVLGLLTVRWFEVEARRGAALEVA
jgi:ABC-2 type transport system permease protein